MTANIKKINTSPVLAYATLGSIFDPGAITFGSSNYQNYNNTITINTGSHQYIMIITEITCRWQRYNGFSSSVSSGTKISSIVRNAATPVDFSTNQCIDIYQVPKNTSINVYAYVGANLNWKETVAPRAVVYGI